MFGAFIIQILFGKLVKQIVSFQAPSDVCGWQVFLPAARPPALPPAK